MKYAKRKLTIALVCCAGIVLAAFVSIFIVRHFGNSDAVPSPGERAFVDSWRNVARNPFPAEGALRGTGFAINVPCENPVLRRLTVENAGDAVLDNFWFHREGAPNFYSVPTLIRTVTNEDQSDSEKVIALFELFRTHYENFWPISPAGMLDDPPTLLGSVGYGQCNLAANAFELLCQSVGVETRRVTLGLVENGQRRIAHSVMEAYFDGGWHYFDPDGRVFYRLPDGTVASVEHLKEDASLIRAGSAPIGYVHEWYAAAFERGGVHVYEPRRSLRRKTMYEDLDAFPEMYRQAMRYDLPPGMKLVLSRAPAEKFFVRGLGGVSDKSVVNGEVPPCAAGQVHWRISRASFEAGANVYSTGDELLVAIGSPYVIAGGEVAAETGDNGSSVGFLPFVFGSNYRHAFKDLALSPDGKPVNIGPELPKANPVTGFALKVSGRKKLRELRVTADIQHNPRALPKLVAGENRFVLWAPWPCAFSVENSPTRSVVETDNGLRICFEFEDETRP